MSARDEVLSSVTYNDYDFNFINYDDCAFVNYVND